MPVERSPPQERRHSIAVIPTTQIRPNVSNALTYLSQTTTKTKLNLPAQNNITSPSERVALSANAVLPTLSWSQQCTTPTTTLANINYPAISHTPNTNAAIALTSTTNTTNTAVTTLACTSTSTTTTTTSTSSSLLPITTPHASADEQHSANYKQVNHTHNIKNPKRARNSPNKSGIVPNISKKLKTKANQQTLTSYWLSKDVTNTHDRQDEHVTSNRFEALSIDETDETSKNSETELEKVPIKKYVPKPPPIYVQNVQCINILTKALNAIPNCTYVMKALNNNEIKIQPAESVHYTAIIKLLKGKDTQYYTYKPKELKGFNVILRNMHYSTDINDIKNELAELGHEVMHIHNILQNGTKKPLSLFSIELKTNKNNKNIYSISHLLHCKITFEPPHQKRSLPQCTNCQKYGHTKNFCTKNPVCVKCAGSHKTIQCPIPQKSDNIKCALCGEKHTANYKGCMVYKALKIKRFPTIREKELPPTTNEQQLVQSQQNPNSQPTKYNYITPNLTYAQATANKNTSDTDINTQHKDCDFTELKDMMKQLIAQMTNMMSIITILVTKLNEQK